jgi:hypothetical protein
VNHFSSFIVSTAVRGDENFYPLALGPHIRSL